MNNSSTPSAARALGDRDENAPARAEALGIFEQSSSTYIFGDPNGATPSDNPVLPCFIGQMGAGGLFTCEQYTSAQQVITLVNRKNLFRRYEVPADPKAGQLATAPKVMITKTIYFEEYDTESLRQITVPAGAQIMLVEQESHLPPSFYIANVIMGVPTDLEHTLSLAQVRFFLAASGQVRVVISRYSAQGKARIKRLSPDELTVSKTI
jgi:hypothetical protein